MSSTYCVEDRIIAGLDHEQFGLTVEIASSPSSVRGYEQRKLDGITRFATARTERLARLRQLETPQEASSRPPR